MKDRKRDRKENRDIWRHTETEDKQTVSETKYKDTRIALLA